MITTELVGKIYDASLETSKWPELLEAISNPCCHLNTLAYCIPCPTAHINNLYSRLFFKYISNIAIATPETKIVAVP